MTQFRHEKIHEMIRSHEQIIADFKEELNNPEKQHIAGVLWELNECVKCLPAHKFLWTTVHSRIFRIYIWQQIPVNVFEDFFDELEETLFWNDYELSPDESKPSSEEQHYVFRPRNVPSGTPIKIIITSGVCKQVNTGRMVPETKTECNFLEDV